MEDDCSLPDSKVRSGNIRMPDESPINSGLPMYFGNENYLKSYSKSQERRQVNDENNGTIKVIHFGVV